MSPFAPSCGRIVIPLAKGRTEITFAPEPATGRMLVGRAPEEAVRLVGMIHNLCGAAHRAAASAALDLPEDPNSGREMLVDILRGHLIILARSVPAILGVESALPIGLLGAIGRMGAADAHGGKLRQLADAIAGRARGERFELRAILAPDTAFSAVLRECLMLEALAGLVWPDFETGAPDPSFFARVADHRHFVVSEAFGPISRRFLGRIFEILALIEVFGTQREAEFRATSRIAGEGVARAGRGTLVHRARVVGGRISDYAIETPTAAMLAPGGALRTFLAALARHGAPDPRLIRLAVLAFDPCLPHQIDFHASMGSAPEVAAHA